MSTEFTKTCLGLGYLSGGDLRFCVKCGRKSTAKNGCATLLVRLKSGVYNTELEDSYV